MAGPLCEQADILPTKRICLKPFHLKRADHAGTALLEKLCQKQHSCNCGEERATSVPSRVKARDSWILGEALLQSWTPGGWDLNLVWEWVRKGYPTPESCTQLQQKALILQARNGGVSLELSAPPGAQWGSAWLPPSKCREIPFQQQVLAGGEQCLGAPQPSCAWRHAARRGEDVIGIPAGNFLSSLNGLSVVPITINFPGLGQLKLET